MENGDQRRAVCVLEHVAKAAGSLPGSKARFGENLKASGLEQARSTGGVRTWRGVQIRRPFSQTRDAD
jgi:hypothetical protein